MLHQNLAMADFLHQGETVPLTEITGVHRCEECEPWAQLHLTHHPGPQHALCLLPPPGQQHLPSVSTICSSFQTRPWGGTAQMYLGVVHIFIDSVEDPWHFCEDPDLFLFWCGFGSLDPDPFQFDIKKFNFMFDLPHFFL